MAEDRNDPAGTANNPDGKVTTRAQSRPGRSRTQGSKDQPLESIEESDNEGNTPTPVPQGRRHYTKALDDGDKLDNCIDPTFKSWARTIKQKLLLNGDHYPTEQHKMYHVFTRTTGTASRHLEVPFDQDEFSSSQEMIEYLGKALGHPFEVSEAKDKYADLQMDQFDTFLEFKTEFTLTANLARIRKEDWFHDMKRKQEV